jgi:uncharacterized protein
VVAVLVTETPRPKARKRHGCLAIAALAALLLAYARWIEPRWVEVTHHELAVPASAGLPAGRRLRIAHLTDLHTRGLGANERKLLETLDAEQPDLIVITGDSVADRGSYEDVRMLLARLRAPLGVFAVRGNWENWIRVPDETAFYASTGVRLLVNEAVELAPGIWIAGFDDPRSGLVQFERAAAAIPRGAFCIALFHSPELFDELLVPANLCFAGHTHGGQIRLPFVGALWLPEGCGRYEAGWYERANAKLYVGRGLGTSILPLRFLCRPEIAIVTLAPQP